MSKSALIQSYGDYVLHRKTCAVIKEIFKEHHDGAYSHYGDNAGEYRYLEACRNIVYKPFEQDAERDEQAGFQHCAEESAGGIGQQPDFYLSLLLFPCPPCFGRDFIAQNFRLFDFHTILPMLKFYADCYKTLAVMFVYSILTHNIRLCNKNFVKIY